MTKRLSVFFLAILGLVCGPAALALDPSLTFFQYEFSYPGDGDAGVPYEIYDVVEDDSGYLWLATVRGLMRYDGRETTLYRVSRFPGVLSNSPRHLLVDSSNRLFVASDRGVSVYRDGVFTPILETRNAEARISTMAEGDNGQVWLGGDSGLWAYHQDELRAVTAGVSLDRVSALLWHGGRLYIGQRGVVTVIGSDETYVLPLHSTLSKAAVEDLEFHQDKIWVATLSGLSVLENNTFRSVNSELLAGLSFDALLSDRDQNLWFSGPRRVGRFYPDGSLELPDVEDERMGFIPQLTNIFEDRAGTHWHTSRLFGLSSLRDTPIARVSATEGLPSPNVTAVAASADGVVYVATDAGIAALENGESKTLIDQPFPVSNAVRALLPVANETLWVGTESSLRAYSLVENRWHDHAALLELDSAVNALASSGTGALWVATDHGLFSAEKGQLHAILDTGDFSITALHVDARGELWVGAKNGIAKLTNDRLQWQAAETPAFAGSIISIAETSSGSIVAAVSDGGLVIQHNDGWTRFGEADGLPPENLIAVGIRGNEMWLITGAGVFRANLDDTIADVKATVQLQPVTTADRYRGPYASYCCRGESDQAVAMTSSNLVVSTDDGVVVFNTNLALTSEAAPRPYLKNVTSSGESLSFSDSESTVLPQDSRSISFDFSAVDLIHGDKVNFRHRLRGLSDDWVETGVASSASFPSLPSGSYVFELQASASPGVWSDTTASFAFSAKPFIYETALFRVGVWLASVAVVFLLAWLRMTALRGRHEKLELGIQQRTTELHRLNEQLLGANKSLEEVSLTDPLTGLVNRRFFDQPDIAQQIASRIGEQGLIVMMDIDHFKRVNDSYGHAAGDEVLSQFAALLRKVTREADIVARWGGEEFLLICQIQQYDAATLLDRIAAAINDYPFQLPRGSGVEITSSVGAVRYPLSKGTSPDQDLSGLIEMADSALYFVKVNNRDGWALLEGSNAAAPDLTDIHKKGGLAKLIDSGELNWQASRSDIRATMDDTVTRLRALKPVR